MFLPNRCKPIDLYCKLIELFLNNGNITADLFTVKETFKEKI